MSSTQSVTSRIGWKSAAPFVLLGVVAYKTGKPLEWDAATLKCKGVPEADSLIHKEYRKGWEPT